MAAFIHPDAIIISISMGASTIPASPLNKNPEPKRYRCPLSRIISPMYIKSVTTDAKIDGSNIDHFLSFPSVNELTKMPTVIPNNKKNIAINMADTAETVISPVR